MTIDDLKKHVGTMLTAAFPTVTIHFDRIGDDPFHIGVSVYGVDANAVKWVKSKILEIDEKLCANTDFAITPLVRDVATTEKYYPQFVSPWKSVAVFVPNSGSMDAECMQIDLSLNFEMRLEAEPICPIATNEELALAA